MTQPFSSTEPRLWSQTHCDDRGNFAYSGDLYIAGEHLPDLCRRIDLHLTRTIVGARFSVTGERFSGGRSIRVELLDAPGDLSDEDARRAFETLISDQAERFNVANGNLLQDYMICSFFLRVSIGTTYWSALSARRGHANPVEARIPLARFKRQLRPGHKLKLIAARAGHRALGTIRTVTAVRSGDLILEDRSYLSFPRASAFACDGKLIRIANGRDEDPDDHLLYEWIQDAA
ncbi:MULTISPECIES: hypothetical protein [Sphingomonadales]|jgi:hypothetical protein|uniref:Uncharacterized protein n=1 Tax=Aurantiacibacter xanthus TaxID=1784712 RepID=A0A3A1P2U0_9SPHN|nr:MULTISPECIES: hypothetical protein [Sphingomonadales]RIV83716.1 hypothetical protein D2V17_12365 [Aurantiacibacter xanthus]|tara:strand:- start:3985 stop:4683 length:699 start_codon:yes stop_codon:yes gene_type:complete